MKTFKDEDVAQNFKAGQVLGVAEYMNSRGEAVYHSTRREPLGKAYVRGHSLPSETLEPAFPGFGHKPRYEACGAKESIFPRGVDRERPEDRARYCKTHSSYEAGERALRGHDLPAATQRPNFRFGLPDNADTSNRGADVMRAMESQAPMTTIGSQLLERKRQVASDRLGQARGSLQGAHPSPPGGTYGKRSDPDALDVGTLLRGFYTDKELQPDADLGTCVLPGRRNFPTAAPLGAPSVRSDLLHRAVAPENRSLTNATNFGDDPDAVDLIFPEKFVHRGVGDQDFCQRRSAAELRSIMDGAGYALSDEGFEAAFQTASGYFGDGAPLASVEAMMVAYFDTVGGRPLSERQSH